MEKKKVVVKVTQYAVLFQTCCTFFADLQMQAHFRVFFQSCSSWGNADDRDFLWKVCIRIWRRCYLNIWESWKNWPPLRGLPTDPTPRTTLRTSPRTTMRTTLTNQPNLLSRRKELEEAYLPTRWHLINSRHLDFRHFTRPSPSSSLLRPLQLPFLDRHATLLSKPRVAIQITTACPK